MLKIFFYFRLNTSKKLVISNFFCAAQVGLLKIMKNKIIILFGLLRYYNKEHKNRIKMKIKYGFKREREIKHYKQYSVQTDLDFGKGCWEGRGLKRLCVSILSDLASQP